jgi:multiple sugar transport system ATP-binding protein
MNLFAGSVERDAAVMAVRFGEHRLVLDDEATRAFPSLDPGDHMQVVVGIRPEALTDVASEPGAPPDHVIEATVDLVESLGAELLVHVAVMPPEATSEEDGTPPWREALGRRGRAVARLSTRRRPTPGEVIKLAVEPLDIHLFDAETGDSLRDAGAASEVP